MKKKENLFIVILAVIGSLWYIHIIYTDMRDDNSLKRHKEFVIGIIQKFHKSKNNNYLDYTFTIDSITYEGSGFHYPKWDTYVIGDSIPIVYDTTNPRNNKPYRDTFQ